MLRLNPGSSALDGKPKEPRVSPSPDLRLDDRVAVVTGAGSGIGAAIAAVLAACGAHVVLAGRRTERLEQTLEDLPFSGPARGLAVETDVRSPSDAGILAARAVGEFGRIDILVNNAGTLAQDSLLDETDDMWSVALETNLGGARNCMRAVGPVMIEAKRGKVITISSAFARHTAPLFASYSTSKAALIQLTKSVALEWARHGIQVNAIAPGYVETDINAEARSDEHVRDVLLRQIPARRFGHAVEVGWAAAFLASGLSDYITGETLVVDGGWSL
jgi:NAD(P)-dependent dehydrogenase (short-subunit alcohol dehydrogenase family)